MTTSTSTSSSSTSSSLMSTNPKTSETRLIRVIKAGFRRWAFFIAGHTKWAIGICLVLSVLGTAKMVTTPPQNDIAAYSPYGARSRQELKIYEEFFDASGKGISAFAIVVAKDGGSMLRPEMLDAAVNVDDIITEKFPIYNARLGIQQTFGEFCDNFCQLNEPVRQFRNGFILQVDRVQQNLPLNDRINLSYPVTTIYGREINLQPNFFGLKISDSGNNSFTNLKSAKMLALLYRAEQLPGWQTNDVKSWEKRVTDYFAREYDPDNNTTPIQVMVMSHTLAEAEIERAGAMLLPFLGVGFIIMTLCSVTTTLLSALYMQQVSAGKVLLAVMAGINPFLASGTALGLLLSLGMRNGSILCITPFLVLAIGVDNAYLMVHAWQRVTKRMRNWPVKEDSPGHRLAEVLHETGPAILISMLTNILADAVGAVTSSPDITLLCVGNLVSLLINFIYQLTIYSSVMLILGEREMRLEAQRREQSAIASCELFYNSQVDQNSICCNSSNSFNSSVKHNFTAFLDGYARKITNTFVATFILLLWLSYIAFSIKGITRMNINLTPSKLVAADSIFIEADRLRQEYVIPYYTMTYIFVNKPGNLSDPVRFQLLTNLVNELEQRNDSWGPVATKFFLRDYEQYKKYYLDEADLSRVDVAEFELADFDKFLTWPEFHFWKGFVKLANNSNSERELKSFFFTTAYHGSHLREWINRVGLLHQLRAIVDKYDPIFNVSIYHDDAIYMDFIENMPSDTWQSIVTTLICMGLLCFVFMYDTFTVIVSMAAIASICAGILGFLSWFGVDLDPITMSATLISIGFSIDVPAHVAYHFHASEYENGLRLDVTQRLTATFASVGFPAMQASLSTSLCVLSLMLVPLYTSNVFAKTMLLCLSLCLIHGLVVIPALFTLGHRLRNAVTIAKWGRSKDKYVVNAG